MPSNIDYKALRATIKERCDRDTTRELLECLGVEVRRDYRFRDNDSFSISKNGLIKDFGSTDFSGDIVAFMIDILVVAPREAIEWTAKSLGVLELPSPEEVEVKARLKALSTKPKKTQPLYNLEEINDSCVIAGELQPYHLEALKELIHPCLWNSKIKTDPFISYSKIFKDIGIGWSSWQKSITVSFFDELREVKTLIIRHSITKDGTAVKWKTYGSKTFAPYKINKDDEIVFVASGIGEYILLELMGVSYIALQSDSTTSGITSEIIEACRGKTIFYLQDNDDSGRKLATKLEEIFIINAFVVVDFEFIQDKHLPHGYDFRDFCKDMAVQYGDDVWTVIKDMLLAEIKFEMEKLTILRRELHNV